MSERPTSPDLMKGLGILMRYQRDRAEDAWEESPEGLRNTARLLRERAARDLAEAERLERMADAVSRDSSS